MEDSKVKQILQELKKVPELGKDQYYIYAMENDIGKIKIGRTGNIYERYQSLCGSNSQGNKILKVYCSPATYLYCIENIVHQKFDKYRIKGTEWFYDENLRIEDVVNELELLFSSTDYEKCNLVRKEYMEKKG